METVDHIVRFQDCLDLAWGDPAVLRLSPEELAELVDFQDCLSALQKAAEKYKSTLPASSTSSVPTLTISGFEVLAKIGQGGMGVVYKARQEQPRRIVALKMILGDPGREPERLERFRREMQAVASLEHDHIVRLYETREADGQIFFTLEYVEGGTLAERIGRKPQAFDLSAQWVRTLAEAMEYAHRRGVVHRDLKPGNVLLTTEGRLKLTDFGLAKLADDPDITRSSQCLGTPCYMAPEQAAGTGAIGPHTDVYALGAILYELLTGRPPFLGATVMNTIDQVRSQEPVSPRRLRLETPKDLETICLKCLQKEPSQRYASAAALADDLSRFANHLPISARPVGRWERSRKWIWRNPTWASVAAFGFLFLTLGPAAGISLWWQRQSTADAEAVSRRQQYFRLIALSDREWHANRLEMAEQLLEECPLDQREWEWRFLKNRLHSFDKPLDCGGASKNNRIGFTPDRSSLVAFGEAGIVSLWDFDTNYEKKRVSSGLESFSVGDVHPSKPLIAIGRDDCTVQIVETKNCTVATTLGPFPGRPKCIAFHPRKSLIAVECDDTIQIVDKDGTAKHEIPFHRTWESLRPQMAFDPAGDVLVCANWSEVQGELIAYSLREKRTLWSLTGNRQIHVVPCFAADGESLFVGRVSQDDRLNIAPDILVLDAKNGNITRIFKGHTARLESLAISPDGKWLASAARDQTVRIWNIKTGLEARVLRFPTGVTCATFIPGTEKLATACLDGIVRVLDWQTEQGIETYRHHTAVVNQVHLHPDTRRFISISADAQIVGMDRTTRMRFFDDRHEGEWKGTAAAALSPDGARLLTVSKTTHAKVWNVSTSQLLFELEHKDSFSAAASVDGRFFATGGDKKDPSIRLWDAESGKLLRTFPGHSPFVSSLAFSRDNRLLASSGVGEARLWRLDNPSNEPIKLDHPKDEVSALAFSPDGKTLATGSVNSGIVALWDIEAAKQLSAFRGHFGKVATVFWSPNGARLASGGNDKTIRIWDVKSGMEVLTLAEHRAGVTHVQFDGSGDLLVSASWDGTIKFWNGAISLHKPTSR